MLNDNLSITEALVLWANVCKFSSERYSPRRLIVYSRDELKTSEMKSNPAFRSFSKIFSWGCTRRERLCLAEDVVM